MMMMMIMMMMMMVMMVMIMMMMTMVMMTMTMMTIMMTMIIIIKVMFYCRICCNQLIRHMLEFFFKKTSSMTDRLIQGISLYSVVARWMPSNVGSCGRQRETKVLNAALIMHFRQQGIISLTYKMCQFKPRFYFYVYMCMCISVSY